MAAGAEADASFRLLATHLRTPPPLGHAEAVLLLERLLLSARRPDAPPAATAGLARLLVAIDQDPCRTPPAALAAHRLGWSLSHFRRVFRTTCGLPYQEHVVRRRLDAAAQLLITSDRTVAGIGAAVGYREPTEFSRVFRRRYGIAPGFYRRACGQGLTSADRGPGGSRGPS